MMDNVRLGLGCSFLMCIDLLWDTHILHNIEHELQPKFEDYFGLWVKLSTI